RRRARPAPDTDTARHRHQLADEAVLSAGDRGAGKGTDHASLSIGYRPEVLRLPVLRPFPEWVVSRALRGSRLRRPRGRRPRLRPHQAAALDALARESAPGPGCMTHFTRRPFLGTRPMAYSSSFCR